MSSLARVSVLFLSSSSIWISLILCANTGNTVQVDPSRPEGHREFFLVPFQDIPSHGVLHNGFGIEISGADYNNFREGRYRAWLRNHHEVVLRLPTVRSTMLTPHGHASYEAQRQRLGGHSDTYEVSRMVVRNRLLANEGRQKYHLLLVFPREYDLTNAVMTPHHSPFGEIEPQITPVEVNNVVGTGRSIVGIEVDIAFAMTIVEEEERRAVATATDKPQAQAMDDAMQGMTFVAAPPANTN